ncbi:hypothetical protein Tco_0944281 [Tanacetum coccineum]
MRRKENKENNFVYGDIGQTLVIRKSFLPSKEEECGDWLRNNIFHMTSTIKEKRPKPYKYSWTLVTSFLKGLGNLIVAQLTMEDQTHTASIKTLVLSKVVGLAKPTKKDNEHLLSISNFMDEVDESGIMHALVVRDEEPLN